MQTIVFVDDDAAIRDSFALLVDSSRFRLMALADARLILAEKVETPDLFILDRGISGTDGLDLCRFIKSNEKYRKVPVIMLSASPEILTSALAAGADNAISKPYRIKEMREMINEYTHALP